MIDFLIQGGPLFTFTMTSIFLINVILIARSAAFLHGGKFSSRIQARRWIDPVKHIGIFLLTVGILGQIIGIYSAFKVIEMMQIEVSPALMAGGLRVSAITTLLGFAYFLISYISWFFLSMYLPAAKPNVAG